jgi:hypothetical protein
MAQELSLIGKITERTELNLTNKPTAHRVRTKMRDQHGPTAAS